ncbi:MAG: (Fe-S)-binding protein, partial [Deltaproteobacteria bacterium]|nr:(Fe-S)-binding protein [Deltaproteobacteria bacterium]
KEILEGNLEPSEEIAETFYACTGCQSCADGCPSGVKAHEIVLLARKHLFRDGFAPENLLGVRDSVCTRGNVFGSKADERVEIYPSIIREKARKGLLKEKAETLFFMGCLPSYMDMKIVPAFFISMDAAKVDYTTLSTEETCCGFPLYLMGSDDFKSHSEFLLERIKQTEARELVTPCAGCYKTFKTLYPELEALGIGVFHSVQYMDKMIDEGRIRLTGEFPKRVTYHDPCDLARACGIVEAPRRILANIPALKYVEMKRNRLEARCCGAGGGLQAYKPELSIKMASQRIRDAFAVEADILVSACPACKDNLRKGMKNIPKSERRRLKIMDLTEIISRAL